MESDDDFELDDSMSESSAEDDSISSSSDENEDSGPSNTKLTFSTNMWVSLVTIEFIESLVNFTLEGSTSACV